MEEHPLPNFLTDAAIKGLPDTAFYIPQFISLLEEELLLQKINSAPLPTWRHLSHRRLQTYPSPLSPTNTLLASPLPPWLSSLILPRLHSIPLSLSNPSPIFSTSPHHSPNHVLVNEYTPGQGIFPHEDGSAYYPIVATVSLGSHTVLDIYAKKQSNGNGQWVGKGNPQWRVLQERRSLLITTGTLYEDHLHGISEKMTDKDLGRVGLVNWDMLGDRQPFENGTRDRGTRVSLTFRDVLMTKELGKAMAFLGKVR